MKKVNYTSLINKSDYSNFCKNVWKACLLIPAGEVRTYGWVARKIGLPRASRSVGNALAKNPFAPGVPCHRVIRSDGKLGGYSGGIRRKERLLRCEGFL